MAAGAGTALVLVLVIALLSFSSEAGETVVIRGIVQPGGSSSTVSVSYAQITTAADKTKWRGLVCDVNLGSAKKYQWQNKKGVLKQVRVASNPTPGKEVVFKGTISSDCRVTASWIVENYRYFTMTGTLQGNKLDTGKKDAGNLTVTVSKLIMTGIKPEKKFKESQFKDVDVLVNYNGLTDFTALGKSKLAEEVTASQQTVVIEGQMEDESKFVATKVKEQ